MATRVERFICEDGSMWDTAEEAKGHETLARRSRMINTWIFEAFGQYALDRNERDILHNILLNRTRALHKFLGELLASGDVP